MTIFDLANLCFFLAGSAFASVVWFGVLVDARHKWKEMAKEHTRNELRKLARTLGVEINFSDEVKLHGRGASGTVAEGVQKRETADGDPHHHKRRHGDG